MDRIFKTSKIVINSSQLASSLRNVNRYTASLVSCHAALPFTRWTPAAWLAARSWYAPRTSSPPPEAWLLSDLDPLLSSRPCLLRLSMHLVPCFLQVSVQMHRFCEGFPELFIEEDNAGPWLWTSYSALSSRKTRCAICLTTQLLSVSSLEWELHEGRDCLF